MSVSLNTRLQSLAQTQKALAPETAQQLAKEFKVDVATVESAFATQQKALAAGVGSNESIQQKTSTLRDQSASNGNLFAGQKTAQLSSSPALQGKNLSVPGDAVKQHFAPILEGLGYLTERVKQGRLGSPALDVEAQALFKKAGEPSDKAYQELWSDAGTPTRNKMLKVLDDLAAVLPHAVISENAAFPGRTVAFDALQMHIVDAQLRKDGGDIQKFAGQLAAQFPNDPLAPWAAGLAKTTSAS